MVYNFFPVVHWYSSPQQRKPHELGQPFSAAFCCAALCLAQSAAPSLHETTRSVRPSIASRRRQQAAKPAPAQHYRPERFAGRAGTYYRLVWGIDGLSVKSAEAGEVIRFTYQVLDPEKAKMLNDKKIEPALIDERAHVKLVVPQMDKVGKLRQTQRTRKREERIGCCSRTRADMSSAETGSVW